MLGVPLDGAADLLCDNMSVVMSLTIPGSVLKKKHNAVSYHKVRETIKAKAVRVRHSHWFESGRDPEQMLGWPCPPTPYIPHTPLTRILPSSLNSLQIG
jgi:hypothetical protein